MTVTNFTQSVEAIEIFSKNISQIEILTCKTDEQNLTTNNKDLYVDCVINNNSEKNEVQDYE